jgi:hypothetical protein
LVIEPRVHKWDGKLDTTMGYGDPGHGFFLTCDVKSPPGMAQRRKNVYLLLTEENATKLLVLLRDQLRDWRSEI